MTQLSLPFVWQDMSSAPKRGVVWVLTDKACHLAHFCDYVEDHPPISADWYYLPPKCNQFMWVDKPIAWMPNHTNLRGY